VEDVFESLKIGLYKTTDEKKYKRLILANGGIIANEPFDDVDFVVTGLHILDNKLSMLASSKIMIFYQEWIEECLKQNKLDLDNFRVTSVASTLDYVQTV
jgi:hypothetical protein